MDAAHFVAALLGPLYIAVGLGIFLNPDHYQRMALDFLRSPALTYIGGAMAMSAGLSILYFHNAWVADWTVIITIIGWLAALKGAHLLILPGRALTLWSPVIARSDWLRALSFGTIAFGIFLTLAAYGWT